MKAAIQWLTKEIGLIRLGPKFEIYGDPYEAVCTVIRNGPDAKIFGLCGKFSRKSYLALEVCLRDEGIRNVTWERMKSEGVLSKERSN